VKAENKGLNIVNAWVEQRRVRTRVKRTPSVNSIDNGIKFGRYQRQKQFER
jgi:hypothetical protein